MPWEAEVCSRVSARFMPLLVFTLVSLNLMCAKDIWQPVLYLLRIMLLRQCAILQTLYRFPFCPFLLMAKGKGDSVS